MLDDMFDVVETAVDVGEAVLNTLKKRKDGYGAGNED